MAKLSIKEIGKLAREIVKATPGGIRFQQLRNKIVELNPETPANSVNGGMWNLDQLFPNEIAKPSRGLFVAAGSGQTAPVLGAPVGVEAAAESDFYKPFAEWLRNELDEVTTAIPLGGAGLRGKWATPDVVGVYKARTSDMVKFPFELVSAELKVDAAQPVVAFGQAIAYRLFSHKTFVVMPRSMTEEDSSRLDALCMLFGVGFVVFDVNQSAPRFESRARARRFDPDMFYLNEFAARLHVHNPEAFEILLG